MKIAIVMGSDSDWSIMQTAVQVCQDFGVDHEARVISAHRTPQDMVDFGNTAYEQGYSVIIAGAGGAAHLPGMLASTTSIPVIGVPIKLSNLDGMDSLLSIVQMPTGVPVATVAINNAMNAALLALRILAVSDSSLRAKLDKYRQGMADHSRSKALS